MYEQRGTSIPRKNHADYRYRGNWGTTKNMHTVVYSFNLWDESIKKMSGDSHVLQKSNNV